MLRKDNKNEIVYQSEDQGNFSIYFCHLKNSVNYIIDSVMYLLCLNTTLNAFFIIQGDHVKHCRVFLVPLIMTCPLYATVHVHTAHKVPEKQGHV